MPIAKYFKGKGEKVMRAMVKEYGPKKSKQVFYATANKQKKRFAQKTHNGRKVFDLE